MMRSLYPGDNPLTALLLAGILAMAGGVAVSPATAEMEIYSIDASHSQVGFSIVHFFAKVPGRFTGFEGSIAIDPSDLGAGSVEVVIDAASIDTANSDRDGHLRGVDFFDVANYPRITFRSSSVTPTDANTAQVEGVLTMRGISQPVTLEVEFLGSGPDAWGGHRSGFEARTTINRKDFGITWNKVLDTGGVVLGDAVDILINIEGIRQEPPAAEEPEAAEEPAAEEGPEAAEPPPAS